ncbi:hypothetical protein MNBD_GAMMA10-775 [hydrothermal vent metagenome]|uniref:Transposase IS4-like domain-containing protein n=1 Tax=hydrothermal vent metagenome TaxID=652676 RepID=A0A3B0X7E2_9ZZZZ
MHFNAIDDPRQQGKCEFSYHDVLMSAFSCMYFQEPSLAQFQLRMEEAKGKSNLQTLFGVQNIPQDTQLRDIIDTIESDNFAPIFKDYFSRLRRHKHLKDFEVLSGLLMCVIDGTQYHSSTKVKCDGCLTKKHKKGEITYSHSVLQGAIMHPDQKQVLPVMPEAIQNTDGSTKQDCESKAAKRFVGNLKKAHPRQGFIIAGDGLMSHQPMMETVIENGMHCLFVAKPGDHQYLFEWIDAFEQLPSVEITDQKGRVHQYRWKNDVPLNGRADALRVNYIEYSLINEKGKRTYHNSWVTDLEVTQTNIVVLAQAGRCRWKIENECFNTLKNQGYYLEHNYGHGKKHLSFNMYLLTLLAFYFHQIFELTDKTYQACRKRFGSKRYLWESFRGAIQQFLFNDWTNFYDFMLNPDDYEVIVTKKV